MKNFKSYVKSNPNDAVPILRSVPEISSFLKDLSHEIKFLQSCAMKSLDTPDEFFGVYRLLLEKNSILSNVRVSSGLTKDSHHNSMEGRVSKELDIVKSRLDKFLDTSIDELSSFTGSIPTKLTKLIEDVTKNLSCSSVQVFRLPRLCSGNVYTAKISNLALKNQSKYNTFYLHVYKNKDSWETSCGHSLYQLIDGSQFSSSDPFTSMKTGISNTLELLSNEGVKISPVNFSLTPTQKEKNLIRIGVVGYSSQSFDQQLARELLVDALKEASKSHITESVELISGLTNIGIPAVAYSVAKDLEWKTAGVACSKAAEYECYPVDRKQIVGDNWGDESEIFLKQLDVLIRIGGGAQSLAEVQRAKEFGIPVVERELETIEEK